MEKVLHSLSGFLLRMENYLVTEKGTILSWRRVLGSIFLLTLLAIFTGCGIRSIPTAYNEVEAQWAEVQNQFKRRADLVRFALQSLIAIEAGRRLAAMGGTAKKVKRPRRRRSGSAA